MLRQYQSCDPRKAAIRHLRKDRLKKSEHYANKEMRNTLNKEILWQLPLFCFVLAGLTGFAYRLGAFVPLPAELNLQNMRHAHSHLMFFGWASPLPMYIFYRQLCGGRRNSGLSLRSMEAGMLGTLGFGLLAYPFFLLYGYHPVPLGEASVPLSVICSGIVMIFWYVYLGGYISLRTKLGATGTNLWFEGALMLLVIGSFGAWGVAVVETQISAGPLWGKALTHFFLACFTEGWVVLAVVGVLMDELQISRKMSIHTIRLSVGLIALGAPLTFSYGISESMLIPPMLFVARIGGGMIAAGLFICICMLFKEGGLKHPVWKWPILFLTAKAILQMGLSVLPSELWLSDYTLRIVYLHLLLLGTLTATLLGWLHVRSRVGLGTYRSVVYSVLIVLCTLVMLTNYWPQKWNGFWMYYAVTGAALLPVAAVAIEWISLALNFTRKYNQ